GALGNTNKYYLFPKASASYRFPALLGEGSEFKLRASYGETGNQPKFGDKFTLASSAVIGGNVGTVLQGTAGSPDVRQDDVEEFGAGFDAQLWRGPATLEVTRYSRHTYDLLVQATPAPVTGFGQRILNGGVLWNEGIEIGAGVTPIQRPNFSWVFRTNFTSLKNRVQELPVPDLCAVGAAVCGFRPPNAGYGLAYGEFFIQQGQAITQIIGTDTLPGTGGELTTRYLGQANPPFRSSCVNDLTSRPRAFSVRWEWQF